MSIKCEIFGAGAILLSTTFMAQAQSVTYNGDTTGAPTWNRLFGTPPSGGTLSGTGTDTPYNAIQIQITDAAAFVAEVTGALWDTTMTLYSGDFDPTDQFTNWVGYDDDDGAGLQSLISQTNDGPYAEGQYTVVVSGFSNSDFGTYVLMLDGVLIGWGPTTAQQLDELKAVLADTGRNNMEILALNVSSAVEESFVTRNLAFGADGQSGKMLGSVYAWARVSNLYTKSDSIGRSHRSPLFQFGGDVAIGQSLVAGLSLGFGDLAASSNGYTFAGSQTLIQPYLGWDHGAWNGTVSAVYGKIDYDTITFAGGTTGAEGEMMAVNADVGYDIVIDPTTTISPFASINAGEIKLTATSGSLAGIGLDDSVSFTEASIGATVAKTLDHGLFTLSLSADHYDTDAPVALISNTYDPNGWSASAELGYQANLSNRTTLDARAKIGGIGSITTSYSGSVGLKITF
jgi:hypothetical protein